MMREDTGNKEAYPFRKPQGFRTIRFHLAAEAVEWLNGTTRDNGGNTVGNHALFYDLLSRMRSAPGRTVRSAGRRSCRPDSSSFRKPASRRNGTQGGKKVRNLLAAMERLGLIAVTASRTASVASVTCIEGWTDTQGNYVSNPCRTAP